MTQAIARGARPGARAAPRPRPTLTMNHAMTLAKALMLPLFVVWWWNPASWSDTATNLAGMVATISIAYVAVADRLAAFRRGREKTDLMARLELRKESEEANHDSLTAQIATLKAESADNQEKIRATVHRIEADQHRFGLEKAEFQDALATANKACASLAAQLDKAYERIAELQGVSAPAGTGDGP